MTNPANEMPDLAELLAATQALVEETVAGATVTTSQFARLAAEARAGRERAQAEHADKARTGELGSEQRRLQDRIDLRETSWDAVVRGEDPSPEAAHVRADIERRSDEMVAAADTTLAEQTREPGVVDPREELQATFAQVRATVMAIQAEQERTS